MIDLSSILESLMVLKGPNSEELKIAPHVSIHIDKGLLDRESEKIKTFCESIPKEDLVSWRQIKRHVGQDRFSAFYLIALGDKLKVWERFPSTNIEWNVPDWPCAIPKTIKSRYPQHHQEDSETKHP